MFDQDDMDNLGRAAQLNSQAETHAELAKLNQFQREQAAKEAAMPKCPWCAGSVEDNVFKCKHCTSNIEWVNITRLSPCRPQDKESLIREQERERVAAAREKEIEHQAWLQTVLACKKCGEKKPKEEFKAELCAACTPFTSCEVAMVWFIIIAALVVGGFILYGVGALLVSIYQL
jgi:hypothetical protein